MIDQNRNDVGSGKTISEIENVLLSSVLELGKLFLEDRLIAEEEKLENTNYGIKGKKIKNQGREERSYLSYFGESQIIRRRYHLLAEGTYHPLDEYLELPKKKISYSLQSLVGQGSTESDYRASVELLNELLPITLSGTGSKRIVEDMAPLVAAYYDQKKAIEGTDKEGAGTGAGRYLAFGNDGKGVPIVKREREEKRKKKEEVRLMKGKKRGVKKQATVAVSFSFDPRQRDSKSVLRGLFREPALADQERKEVDEKDRRWSRNVHKRAFMCDQKKAIDYAIEDLTKRDGEKEKPMIALVDCGVGDWKKAF